ncbi:MAG TPA: heavy metal-binding domain-containing protein, partial [Verrucomicrobiae bacterium]|nr:heavy metal-binding domain-containing protein [Verrucomicrobiae bacterium]
MPHCCHGDSGAEKKPGAGYTCPMHPEIEQKRPGACPKCGMALEPKEIPAGSPAYTCPMHPEIARSSPGVCPKCGMALELKASGGEMEEKNTELESMARRFGISLLLTLPLLAGAMGGMLPFLSPLMHASWFPWIQFLLATPVIAWGGWPFFERAALSLRHRSLNMFTLIAMGTGAAYLFSAAAVLCPGIFPSSFHGEDGHIEVYFEVAAAITVLVLLGQILELRARSQTS